SVHTRHLLSFPTRRSSDLVCPEPRVPGGLRARRPVGAVRPYVLPHGLRRGIGAGSEAGGILIRRKSLREMGTLAQEEVIGCSRRSEEHTSELQSRENLVCR